MNGGAVAMAVVTAINAGSLLFLVFALVRSMRAERDAKRSVWRESASGWSS